MSFSHVPQNKFVVKSNVTLRTLEELLEIMYKNCCLCSEIHQEMLKPPVFKLDTSFLTVIQTTVEHMDPGQCGK